VCFSNLFYISLSISINSLKSLYHFIRAAVLVYFFNFLLTLSPPKTKTKNTI
jgi:hypothetical protein